MQTYFTFPDGGLKYDCASCGQQCCRGRGFAIGDGELIPLLKRAPELAPHLYLRMGGTFGAVDLTDGCWLLAEDGMCTLETRHGRAAKPSTCRLFPFNRVYRVGEVRVVDLNSVLCPLQAADGDGVRHADLMRDLEELSGSPLLDVPATTPMDLPADWLEREQRAAEEELPEPEPGWLRVYGLSDAAVQQNLQLLAPSLRFNTIFRREGGFYPQLAELLPRRLRALGVLAATTGRAPSLRGLTELWNMHSSTLDVLTNWNEPVHLLRPQFDADVPATLQPALGALLGGAFRGGRTLGELVEAAAQTLEPEARPLAVSLAASQLKTLLPYGA